MTNTNNKDTKQHWHLYGNSYDLQNFMEKHPGGKQILQLSQGAPDITATFESYHAFSDLEKIRKDLDTYKVGKSEHPQMYTFEKGGFYDTLRERVRKYFGNEKQLNHKVKLNNFWIFKAILGSLVFFFNIYMAFFKGGISTSQQCIHAFISGITLLSLGMCVYHDASHFAIFARNFQKNDVFARIMGALFMWRSELWMLHHSFRHHTYTGDVKLDPDAINYQPIIRKTQEVAKNKYLQVPGKILPYFATFFLLMFPGQAFGQVIAYNYTWPSKGYMWRLRYPKEILRRTSYEIIALLFGLLIHLYRWNLWVSMAYYAGINISYALAIIPDHDTRETHKNYDPSKKDWGEVQVRNSGNFGNKWCFDIFNHIFGGINYQIEHHLFPSMNSTHLNKISPIVQQTCKEFNVPYISHQSVSGAYLDFLKQITHTSYQK